MSEQITNGKTEGPSPKAVAATLTPLLAGAILAVLDLTGAVSVDDSIWITMLGVGPVTGASAAAAKTGTVRRK